MHIDYQFLRLGKAGYTAIMSNLTLTAHFLADGVTAIGDGNKFVLMSKIGTFPSPSLIILLLPLPVPCLTLEQAKKASHS